MTQLEHEAIIDTTRTVPVKAAKPGDVGKHSIPGLRGYRVIRFNQRDQFVFSTLSGFLLGMLGAVHVGESLA